MSKRKKIREIDVRRHAVERWRQRMRDERCEAALVPVIEERVREALAEGRLQGGKPKAYRPAGTNGSLSDPRDLFLPSPEGNVAFVVRREDQTLVVLTVLTPVWATA